MNNIDSLNTYKQSLISLGSSFNERKFLEDSFTRWYLNAGVKSDLIPQKNIVNLNDLKFANKHRKCNFNVSRFNAESKRSYDAFKKSVGETQIYRNEDFLISRPQLDRLRSLYNGPESAYEFNKNKLIQLYKFIGMNSAHLSIPPIFGGVELFGSPLNTHNPYCSPFKFESIFGSLGSFFDYSISKSRETLYTCNPPFDEDIMNKMADRLEHELKQTKQAVTVVITIPVWDSESQRQLGLRDFGLRFEAFDKLKLSKYFKGHVILGKDEYKYWDYYKQAMVPVSYTHLIVLANEVPQYDIAEIQQMWAAHRH